MSPCVRAFSRLNHTKSGHPQEPQQRFYFYPKSLNHTKSGHPQELSAILLILLARLNHTKSGHPQEQLVEA